MQNTQHHTGFEFAEGVTDRRASRRREIDHPAQICLPGNADSICCRLVDLSSDGARLTSQSPHRVPESFMLKSRSANLHHEATVVWRRGSELAVRFAGA